MDVREKLVELLEGAESVVYWNSSDKGFVEKIADHLIENGVTIKQGGWVPVSLGFLPEDYIRVLACTKHGKPFTAHCEGGKWRVAHSVKITHWMPLPEPPAVMDAIDALGGK